MSIRDALKTPSRAKARAALSSSLVFVFDASGGIARGSAGPQLSQLLQHGVQIGHSPMVGDLSVADPHRVDRFELDGLAGGGDTEKVAELSAVVGLVGGDDVAVDGLPMDLGPAVGKRIAQSVVEDANSGLVGRGAWLGGVVDEVVGEQFVKQREIALSLDLFGVAADHRLQGFAVGS